MLLSLIPAISLAKDGEQVRFYGDMNSDDLINTADATLTLKVSAGLITLTDEQKALTREGFMHADANINGTVNTADAVYILKCSADMALPNTYTVGTTPTTEPTEQPTGEPTEQPTDEPTEQPTDEPTEQPTDEPTGQPTGEPTEQPTSEPTQQPTAEPTATPTPTPDAFITINCYDVFNEQQVAGVQMGVYEGENVINKDNIVFPEANWSYVLENENYSAIVTVTNGVPEPASLKVNVIPVAQDNEGKIYKVILTYEAFRKIDDDLTGYYALGADIDFNQVRFRPLGWNKSDPKADATAFTGVFDGCNHSITNLWIYYTSEETEDNPGSAYWDVGIFSQNAGTIRNLNVYTSLYSNAYGVFGDVNVGVIAGINAGLIQGCRCYGSVGALDLSEDMRGGCGGICGTNLAIVKQCSFDGGTEGFYYIGGLIGKNMGQLTESYFAGGINCELDINYCNKYAVSRIGGLCGYSNGSIINCYVYQAGIIRGRQAVGGMVGAVSGGTMKNIFVSRVDISCVQGYEQYCASDAGYVYSMPQCSGLYARPDDVLGLPSTFSSEWDMQGACHPQLPDLVNVRRPEGAFFVEPYLSH